MKGRSGDWSLQLSPHSAIFGTKIYEKERKKQSGREFSKAQHQPTLYGLNWALNFSEILF